MESEFEKPTLNSIRLRELGIGFESSAAEDAFINILENEIHRRVMDKAFEGVDEEKREEFKKLESSEERKAWIKKYLPPYEDLYQEIFAGVEQELILYRTVIPGNIL